MTQIERDVPLGYAQTRQGQKEEEEQAKARCRYAQTPVDPITTGNLSQPGRLMVEL